MTAVSALSVLFTNFHPKINNTYIVLSIKGTQTIIRLIKLLERLRVQPTQLDHKLEYWKRVPFRGNVILIVVKRKTLTLSYSSLKTICDILAPAVLSRYTRISDRRHDTL